MGSLIQIYFISHVPIRPNRVPPYWLLMRFLGLEFQDNSLYFETYLTSLIKTKKDYVLTLIRWVCVLIHIKI